MKNFEHVDPKVQEVEKKLAEAQSVTNTLKDDDETHKEINDRIGEVYSNSDQIAVIRHAIKSLLDKNGITDEDFEKFNLFADSIVASVKSKKKGA